MSEPFIDLNAQRIARNSTAIRKLYPVLEPDRQHVDTSPPPPPPKAAEPVAAKKKVAFGAKKAFVLANPDLGVDEMFDKAKKAGVPMTRNYVYNVRSDAKAGKKAGKVAKKTAKKASGTVRDKQYVGSRGTGKRIDSRLMDIVSELLVPIVRAAVAEELRRRLGV